MRDKPCLHGLRKIGVLMLALALAVLPSAVTRAQDQQPQPKPQQQAAPSQINPNDTDKMRVQARWGTADPAAAPKDAKTGKPLKKAVSPAPPEQKKTDGTETKQ